MFAHKFSYPWWQTTAWSQAMSLKLARLAKKPIQPPGPNFLPKLWHHNVLLLANEVGFSDATKLDSSDEEIFVRNLKLRFINKQIYVSVNLNDSQPNSSQTFDLLTLCIYIYV